MDWLADNLDVLNLVVNVAMLGVWVLYFNLLYLTFRRQNRPNILINRSAGEDVDSHCLISNMSSSAVYLLAVAIEIGRDGHRWTRVVSDIARLQRGESASHTVERTRQGPIAAGEAIDIGTFGDLIEIAIERSAGEAGAPASTAEIDWLRVTLTAVYTAETDLVGATRGFRVVREGARIAADEPLACQITSRRGRAALRRALADT